jgi:hypothetical protein
MKDLVDLFEANLNMDDVCFDDCTCVSDISAVITQALSYDELDTYHKFVPHLISKHSLSGTITGQQRQNEETQNDNTTE